MSRVCLLVLAALLTCARASEDPEGKPAAISGDENAAKADDRNATTAVTGELDKPLLVRCLESQDRTLYVAWYRGPGKATLLGTDSLYAMSRNALLIRSLAIETLGQYTCQAHNSAGVEAPRKIEVRAYIPDEEPAIKNKCSRPSVSVYQPQNTVASGTEMTTISTSTTTDALRVLGTDKPEVAAFENGIAILRCLFNSTILHSDPPPKITWKLGELKIDGNTSRYRLKSDGALEIVSLNRNDTGVYICVADNGLGNVTQEIHLIVNASGLDNEGHPDSCSTSPHGCCLDGKIPAHGPDFVGCCLLQAFGCCPDNHKPAEGPNHEGCGCQYVLHGCCPDNVTIAQGPDNQGCGCQYTRHGCCPDRHTAASGPNNEGCACNTYQFGCCADGVTTAKGPEQQGCHCRQSTFGCCGDGETPATGPDAAGCDCSSSQHGCCPDGRTEAAGPKFLGCTDAPENKQAACSMPTDPGPCHNFTATWFYDLAYGGCSRFWYGGCDGNGNRFATKEECEDVCVIPSPKDACKLPSVKGACDADYQRWHYNSTREQCVPFRYGGCLGNANNFDSRELCQKQCEPTSVADQCSLLIDQGSCAGNYSRWGFNSQAHRCEQFIWGGCKGNSNRFSSEAACQMRCTGTQPPQCTQSQEAGNCADKEALWSFSQSENRCLPFYYSGCGGNDNRFGSREACEQTCPSAYVPDKCTLPAETGQCSNYRERWFYYTTWKRCLQFYYGGCGGNENNFATEVECDNSCAEIKTTTTTARSVEPQPQTQRPDELAPRPSAPERSDICQLPMLQGPCEDSQMRWFYDPISDSCSQFTYGGCEGNDNRFETQRDCEARCKRPPPTTTTVATPPQQLGEPECKTPSSLTPRGNNETVFYYDSERGQCLVSNFGGCGHPNSYSSEEECERRCGAFRGADVCGARLDPGPCRASIPKIYWDALSGSCQQYAYGGCAGGPNRFSSFEDCMNVCGDTGPARACLQEAHVGQRCGAAQSLRWHYRAAYGDCVVFAYLGCGGNDNNFRSYEHCANVCRVSRTSDDCTPYQQACAALDCQYGVERFTQDGCQRCTCKEDPCVRANCQSNERCVAVAIRDSGSQEPIYSARCVIDSNDIFQCDDYVANCSRLRCEYGIQRTRLLDGCEKCLCLQVEIDCEPLKQECNDLNCNYGIERTVGSDGCERCKCKMYPCERKSCASGERCVVHQYMNGLDLEPQFRAECGTIVKPGACPVDKTTTNEVTCRRECADDAVCRGVGKCCRRGCSDICMTPVEQTSPHPLLTTTIAPNEPAPPIALPPQELEVAVTEGGAATLRCLFHGNPPPKITWRFGEVTIDGNTGRYRLTSDGALEIVSLYRNDTGAYICVADNGVGVAMQEIHLVVNVPVSTHVLTPFSTLNIGADLRLTCEVDGFPEPDVHWTKDGANIQTDGRIAITSSTIVSRLTVTRVSVADSGVYACHASNPYSSQSDSAQINVQQLVVPAKCTDNPVFVICALVVRSKSCRHKYYSKVCCKSCVEAGQLDLQEANLQADQPLKKK